MTGSNRRRAATGVTLVLACALAATAGTSCSPGGAGSVSVPGGKGKLEAAHKTRAFKPEAGSAKPSQKTPRPR